MLEQQGADVLPSRLEFQSGRHLPGLRWLGFRLLVVSGAVACAPETPFGRASRQVPGEPDHGVSPPSVVAAANAFPATSCVTRELHRASLVEVNAVAPPDLRRGQPQPQDENWFPTRLTDIVPVPNGVAVLDGPAGSVTVFSRDFRTRHQWGRRGGGPAELQDARAIALSPGADELWILNGRPPRLTAFSIDGRFLRTISISAIRGMNPVTGVQGVDLAIGGDGTFYLGHQIQRTQVENGPMGLVSMVSSEGEYLGDLVSISAHDWHPPRVVLPFSTEVRVKASGSRVLVIYPVAGVVDVYHEGVTTATAEACLPEALERAYADQVSAATQDDRREGFVYLVTDAALDSLGRIRLVGPLRDSVSQFHVDLFDVLGALEGSIVMPGVGRSLLSHPRFADPEQELVSFNPTGTIVRFRLQSDAQRR